MHVADQYTYWKLVDIFDLLVKLGILKKRPLFVVEHLNPDGTMYVDVEFR